MALWQYTILVVPQGFRNLQVGDTIDELEEPLFWEYHQAKIEVLQELYLYMKEAKSWSSNLRIWGDEDGNCFKIFLEKNMNVISSVYVRIDYTSEYKVFLAFVVEFCIHHGFVLLDEDWKVLPLNTTSIIAVIETCTAKVLYKKLSGQGDNT